MQTTTMEPSTQAIGHIFLVGCPRSGTTLLQSMLATHSQVNSFPETHLFRNIVPHNARAAKLGIASRYAHRRLSAYLGEIGRPELGARLPRRALFYRQYAAAFVAILDTLTRAQGQQLWVEKTPKHVQYIDEISATVERPRFLHLVRDGADVIASLYDVTHRHPDEWNGARTIDQCIARWRHDLTISLAHQHEPNHLFVRYESLVAEPVLLLNKICDFMGIGYEDDMSRKFGQTAAGIMLGSEPWKAPNLGELNVKSSSKFSTVFSAGEQTYIKSAIHDIMTALANRSGTG